ncbi:MAG: carboxylesterase family protein, partial [Proteobacteria bacterium]|nr:carboxylesterase family protein [Pseudomonadota bacterium]
MSLQNLLKTISILALVATIAACAPDSKNDPAVSIDDDTHSEYSNPVIADAVTPLGKANGFVTEEGVVAFLGLPYAQPPMDELRFAPPVVLDSWNGSFDATEFGPACPQSEIEHDTTLNSRIDEDCLTLNIWTPSADNGARPVMFWIHGGGWIAESSGDLLYNGGRLVSRGNIVVVSVEYRLGVFGFSHLEDVPGSGNAGILDQVLALQWVRDNIAAFGGDPNNVTIFGESAGGMSVSALLGMPQAKGLFHRAIMQSNVASLVRGTDYADKVTEMLY